MRHAPDHDAPRLALDDAPPVPRRLLPVLDAALGIQKDIVYREVASRSVLNGPESTGIGCWSLNPYVGCAFGCAYCYARYAHRYTMERSGDGEGEAGGGVVGRVGRVAHVRAVRVGRFPNIRRISTGDHRSAGI